MPSEMFLDSRMPERVVLALHPRATNAARMERQARKLEKFVDVTTIHTDSEPWETTKQLQKTLRQTDLLAVGGGDGTAKQIIADIWLPGMMHEYPDVAVVPGRGGNANDYARAINGRRSLADIVRFGTDMRLRPLSVSIKRPDGVETDHFPLAYFSIGATALASQRLDEIKNTSNPFTRISGFQPAREFIATWLTAGRYAGFDLVHGEGNSEATERVYDIMGARGPIIGKHARTHARLEVPLMELIRTEESGLIRTLGSFVLAAQGKLEGELTDSAVLKVHAAKGQDVPIQSNGDIDWIPSDSTVTMSISKKSFLTRSLLLTSDRPRSN